MSMFIEMPVIIAKIWNEPGCLSADDWKKEMKFYTHTGSGGRVYYSGIKKNEFMRNKINGNVDHHIKRGKPDLDK